MTETAQPSSLRRQQGTGFLVGLLLCCLVLVLLASLFLDRPAIQTDEALFVGGMYPPYMEQNLLKIGSSEIPLMVMTYVGTLKSWIYRPVVSLFGVSPRTVRLPAILISAASVLVTGLVLLLATQSRAATLIACAMLACDPLYVMYSRWDHGPVVTLHLLMMLAVLFGVLFARENRLRYAALAGFCMGLALWEKAIMVWFLIGFGCALVLVVRLRTLRPVRLVQCVVVFAVSLSTGALPLIVYNARNDLVTFRSNTRFDSSEVPQKLRVLEATFLGNAILGSMMRESAEQPKVGGLTRLEQAVVDAAAVAGERRATILPYLFAIGAAVLFVIPGGVARTLGFVSLICMGVAYLQMLLAKGAGTGAHHTILLWPLPYVVIGIAVARGWQVGSRRVRGALVLTAVLACFLNVSVLLTHYSYLVRFGGPDSWTEAMYPALEDLVREKSPVGVIDWGFFDTVRLYSRAEFPTFGVGNPDTANPQTLIAQLRLPDTVFLTHTQGHEMFPGITAKVLSAAQAAGGRVVDRRVYYDYNGVATVETFRLEFEGGDLR